MKNALLAMFALALAANTDAQIVLNTGSYPASLLGTDSLKVTTATSAFPSFDAMANGTWDLTIVTDTTPVYYAYRVPSATYQFADSNLYNFSNYSYQGNVQSSNTSTGLLEHGVSIMQSGYILPAGGPTDSFIFLEQNAIYSSPKIKIAFPATNLIDWASVYRFDLNFEVSVAIASLTHAPGSVRTYITETDSVIGWGKMRVKNLTGGASNWYDILQVKTSKTKIDSFSLQGSFANPLLPTILSALGLIQGQVTKTYEQNYYRTMEVTPFANVQFTDSTYTTPKKVTTHTQRLVDVGVDNTQNEQSVSVYPNPLNGGQVTITLPASAGVWSYEMVNMHGQVLANGALSLNGTHTDITIPASVATGHYYIKVNNNGKLYCVKAIEVVR